MTARSAIDSLVEVIGVKRAEQAYSEVTALVQDWLAGVSGTAEKVKKWLSKAGMTKGNDLVEVEPGSREHGVIHVFAYPDGDIEHGTIFILNPNGMVDSMST